MCFILPILFFLRIKYEDHRQRRLRDLELANAIEISLMSEYQNRESSGEARAARNKYREHKRARVLQLLGPVETILSSADFHSLPRGDTENLEDDELRSLNASDHMQRNFERDDESHNEQIMFVKIPEHGMTMTNRTRLVPGDCIICMTAYEIGEKIVWSSNQLCEHAFHSNCMESWLIKQRGPPLCPCCRQHFIIDTQDDDGTATPHQVRQSEVVDEYCA
jgi:hypothetical protein